MFKLGFFMEINEKKRVVVRKWSPDYQDFVPLPVEETDRYVSGANNREFDVFLGPYPYQ